MSIEIRAAAAADAATLHAVAAATFALACPPGTAQEAIDDFISSTLSEHRFSEYLADPDRALFLAFSDGAAAGYTMVNFIEPSDPDVVAAITRHPSAELSKVYVLAEHHGSGLARELVEASVESAIHRGAAGIWLGVNQFNPRANRFYEKAGFRQVGTKTFLLGGVYENDFVRERAL